MKRERLSARVLPSVAGPVRYLKFFVTTAEWDALCDLASDTGADVAALLRAGFADVLREGEAVEKAPVVPLDTRSPNVRLPVSWFDAASLLGAPTHVARAAVGRAASWSSSRARSALDVPGCVLRRAASERAPSRKTIVHTRLDRDVVEALHAYVPKDPAKGKGNRGLHTIFASALLEAKERALKSPSGPLVRPAAKEDPTTYRFTAADSPPWPRDTYARRLIGVLIEACVPEAERAALLVAGSSSDVGGVS